MTAVTLDPRFLKLGLRGASSGRRVCSTSRSPGSLDYLIVITMEKEKKQEKHWIEGIENVVYDLGGVVIDLDRSQAVEGLKALGILDADALLDQYEQRGPFLLLESGRITTGAFFDEMRRIAVENGFPAPTDTQLTEAFNRFLVRLPKERLEMLRRMRLAGFRIFVLSNTNPVMYNSWIAEAFRAEGGTINDYFDGIVASFQEGTCKPDPAIFETVMRRYGLNPSRTLMLDDSEKNCRGAASTGMHALQVGDTPETDMLAISNLLLSTRGAE